MAEGIDRKLVSTPVDSVPGNPNDHVGGGITTGGVDLEGAPKESFSQGIETVTLVKVDGEGKTTLA